MGMYNAIIPDELLHPTGVFKERLSQSALYAAMQQVTDEEAARCAPWLERKGMRFRPAPIPKPNSPTPRSSSSARCTSRPLRIADDFGCDAIGIQYQQGLKDLCAASDLVEGTAEQRRPPAGDSRDTARVLYRRPARCRISTKSMNAPVSTA